MSNLDINAVLRKVSSAINEYLSDVAAGLRVLTGAVLSKFAKFASALKTVLSSLKRVLSAVFILPFRMVCHIAFLISVIVIATPFAGDMVVQFTWMGINSVREIINLPNDESGVRIKWILPILLFLSIALVCALVAVLGSIKGLFYTALGLGLLAGLIAYAWQRYPMWEMMSVGILFGAFSVFLCLAAWVGIKGFRASSERLGRFGWALLAGLGGVSGLTGLAIGVLGLVLLLADEVSGSEFSTIVAIIGGFFNVSSDEFSAAAALVGGFFCGVLTWGHLLRGRKPKPDNDAE